MSLRRALPVERCISKWILCQFRPQNERPSGDMPALIGIGAEIERPEIAEEERTATARGSRFTSIHSVLQWMLKLTWGPGSIGG